MTQPDSANSKVRAKKLFSFLDPRNVSTKLKVLDRGEKKFVKV